MLVLNRISPFYFPKIKNVLKFWKHWVGPPPYLSAITRVIILYIMWNMMHVISVLYILPMFMWNVWQVCMFPTAASMLNLFYMRIQFLKSFILLSLKTNKHEALSEYHYLSKGWWNWDLLIKNVPSMEIDYNS